MAPKNHSASAGAVILASDINIGASRKRTLLEDRLKVGEVTLSNGETLYLGIVADGIGGENAGERAAEMTITGLFEYMETAPVDDIPQMLKRAIEQVNAQVYAEARTDRAKRDMGSTAAVAAIYQNRLYIANAGDSRVYLVRGKQITQLTVDHTWAYEVVRAGKLKPHEADRNPHRDEIVRSVGYLPDLKVDIGLHLDNGDESDEEAIAAQGYPLQRGDRVLICSDGLTKSRPDGLGNFVEPPEIVKMVNGIPSKEAAHSLVQAALARQVDDNVSVVLMEIPGGKRAVRVKKPVAVGIAGAGVMAVLAIIIALAMAPKGPEIVERVPEGKVLIAEGMDYVSITDLTGSIIQKKDIVSVKDQPHFIVEADANEELSNAYYVKLVFTNAFLYLGPGTEIKYSSDDENQIQVTLIRGRVLLRLKEDLELSKPFIIVAPENSLTAQVTGSIMGVQFLPESEEFYVDCMEGTCRVDKPGNSQVFSEGDHLLAAGNARLEKGDGTRNDLWQFAMDYLKEDSQELEHVVIPPTLTFTPTFTPSPTFTPLPSTPTRTIIYPTDTPQPVIVEIPGPSLACSFNGSTLNITVESNIALNVWVSANFTGPVTVNSASGCIDGAVNGNIVTWSGISLNMGQPCGLTASASGTGSGTASVSIASAGSGSQTSVCNASFTYP